MLSASRSENAARAARAQTSVAGDSSIFTRLAGPHGSMMEDQAQPDQQVPSICSICHGEPPTNPVKLECNHIFCFMCIKSASEVTGLCPLCRTEIGILFNFKEHEVLGPIRTPHSSSGYYWFYEGYRGWWLYDADTNRDLESAFLRGEPKLEKFLAGCVYVIDMRNMTQQRQDGDGRARKICRATLDLENILGIGGLKNKDFAGLLENMKWQDSLPRNET